MKENFTKFIFYFNHIALKFLFIYQKFILGLVPRVNAFPIYAAIVWGLVMFLFDDDPDSLQ
jgi:hypothetical protein